jgi:hypothetical protein
MAWIRSNTAILEVVVILVITLDVVSTGEGLMCSKCNSHTEKIEGECEINPPNPTRCPSSNSVFCITAKELAEDGTLLGFVRDCSTAKKQDECQEIEQSHNAKSPFKICYTTCKSNGCNRSEHLTVAVRWSTLIFLVLCLSLANTLRFQ